MTVIHLKTEWQKHCSETEQCGTQNCCCKIVIVLAANDKNERDCCLVFIFRARLSVLALFLSASTVLTSTLKTFSYLTSCENRGYQQHLLDVQFTVTDRQHNIWEGLER